MFLLNYAFAYSYACIVDESTSFNLFAIFIHYNFPCSLLLHSNGLRPNETWSDSIKLLNNFSLNSELMYLVRLVLKTPNNASFKNPFISDVCPIFVI